MALDVKYVVFSSGALGGLSLIGGWQALEQLNVTGNVRGMSGCSMGSVIATLASLSYTSEEMKTVALTVTYEDYADHSFKSLSETYGIETGRRLMRLIDRLIKFKTGRKGLTFKDHWRLTGRQLWINAAHVETSKCEYYSVYTTPDMLITDAIRRSVSIPFLFASVRTEAGTYVDGGCFDPVPAHMFPMDSTICLNVRNNKIPVPEEITYIDGLFDFSSMLLGGMLTELNLLRFKTQEDQGYKMVYIHTGLGSLSFSLTPEQINRVIALGLQATLDAFKF
jgi:NTE family protein